MYDVGVMGNGALAGLVAITSGTSTIYPWGAIIVGFIAGALYVLGSYCSILLKVRSCQRAILVVCFTSMLVCSAAVVDPVLHFCGQPLLLGLLGPMCGQGPIICVSGRGSVLAV